MKGQVRTTNEEFLENELVIASLDGYGRVQVALDSISVSGGATEAKQDTGNTSLASIDTKTSNLALEATSQLILAKLSSLGPWVDRATVSVAVEPAAATQLPSYACSELKVIADRANTQPIYLGGSGVTSLISQDLQAREVEIITQIANSNQFYVVAAAGHTGQKVRIQTR